MFDGVALKFEPVMVTDAPTSPLVGVKLVIFGGTVTVNALPLVAVSVPTVTVIVPLVAPVGTATTNCVTVAELTVADWPLNLTALLVLVALKFVPLIVTEVPIGPTDGVKLAITGPTVKLLPLVAVFPSAVMLIVPVVAPVGTDVTSCVVVAELTVAAVPLKLIESLAATESNVVPVMVTLVPIAPLVGVKLVILGVTVKLLLLVPVNPPTVTVIVPDIAPLGTATTNCVVVAEVGVAAAVPLNMTVLLALVALKLVPVMVTEVATAPLVGVKLVTVGATVKLLLLVPVNPPIVTEIVPVVAPVGTVTTSCVVDAELGVAAVVPLNLTVLLAAVALKFVPVIVTVAPTAPLVGVKLVILGVTVKLLLLVPVSPPTVTLIVPVVAPLGTVVTS